MWAWDERECREGMKGGVGRRLEGVWGGKGVKRRYGDGIWG